MSKLKFIVIEALDAGGSQTQTDYLVRHLKREGYQPLPLHFPQEDRATGRLIYDKFLLHKNQQPFSRREQALLYIQDFFSRSEDIAKVKASHDKQIAVSDRYCTSTFAYQTINLSKSPRQKMLDWLDWLTYQSTPRLPKPDLVIFLDTPVEVSLRRLSNKKRDYFETRAKLNAIRNSYLKVADEQNWIVLNSVDEEGRERTRQDLHKEIWEIVAPKLR